MEEFKKFEEITEIDERHKLTSDPYTLESLHKTLEKIKLSNDVFSNIRSQFDTAKNVTLYSWFSYDLEALAELKTYILIEYAIRQITNDETSNFKTLLEQVVSREWIKDKDFGHVDCNDDSQEYCKKKIEAMRRLRNNAAHGKTNLEPGSVMHLLICADFINQLFQNYKS